MAHTLKNSFFFNLVVKRQAFLEARTVLYIRSNGNRNKHYNPEFKFHRRLKNQLLPSYTDEHEWPERGPSSLHKDFQIAGRFWNEPRTIASYTHGLIDGYDPLKDDKKSWLSPKNVVEVIQTRRKNKKAIRDIQSYDEKFEINDFLDECDEIYKKANESIAEKDEDKMLNYLTPYAYRIAKETIKDRRIHWKHLKSLDPPKALHIRCATPSGGGGNDETFGQVTVRLHSQQTLAVYDRFGRLIMGSEILAKDVLEIVVFERRLSHTHGVWRIHDKIPVPEGTARTEVLATSRYAEVEEVGEEQQEVERVADAETSPTSKSEETTPAVVTKADAGKL